MTAFTEALATLSPASTKENFQEVANVLQDTFSREDSDLQIVIESRNSFYWLAILVDNDIPLDTAELIRNFSSNMRDAEQVVDALILSSSRILECGTEIYGVDDISELVEALSDFLGQASEKHTDKILRILSEAVANGFIEEDDLPMALKTYND